MLSLMPIILIVLSYFIIICLLALQVVQVTSLVKYSNSSVDVLACFSKVRSTMSISIDICHSVGPRLV